MIRHLSLCLVLPFLLSQCTWLKKEQIPASPKPVFTVDQARYDALKPEKARIKIDLTAQKARLVNPAEEVVVETDISTGKPKHETPTGVFRILEKIPDKRSNRYGRYLDKTGKEIGPSADFPAPPKDAIYEGYQMHWWMRLTWSGIGMHVGYVVPRSAVSYGCIRVPEAVQPLIYAKCLKGTRVEITGKATEPFKPAHAAR